jgi:hypothetical protein
MKNLLVFLAGFTIALQAQAQSTIAFYTTLPQFGSGESTVLYLSGNELFGSFNMPDP